MVSFLSACKEILTGMAPWLVIAVLAAWIACNRSVNLKLTIGDSRCKRKHVND
jgi:hypothetical protein